MDKKKLQIRYTKIIDDIIKMSEKSGNGIVRMMASVDTKGKLAKYSLAYINFRICSVDNGRVLGYDNSHGYHHRHYMGNEEPIEFDSYESVIEQFEKEWRKIHEKAKKYSR
jgi:hypothetical protein